MACKTEQRRFIQRRVSFLRTEKAYDGVVVYIKGVDENWLSIGEKFDVSNKCVTTVNKYARVDSIELVSGIPYSDVKIFNDRGKCLAKLSSGYKKVYFFLFTLYIIFVYIF